MNRNAKSKTRQVKRLANSHTNGPASVTVKVAAGGTRREASNRGEQTQINDDDASRQFAISVFSTSLGWMGLVGDQGQLASVYIGRPTANAVVATAAKLFAVLEESDWNPTVRRMLEDYADGEIVNFSSLELLMPPMTRFRQKIIDATRRLGYGETTSYGELAQRAGHPRAARAVGTVMATNRFPILIPCHRVLASGGKLGGYTSPTGTNLKQQMLEIEARTTGAPTPRGRTSR